jgi:D-alanyl-D-alanine dipeptidase
MRVRSLAIPLLLLAACAHPRPAVAPTVPVIDAAPRALAQATQLVVVTSAGWDETRATLRRFERSEVTEAWRPVGEAGPVVLGRTGLAWDEEQGVGAPAEEPRKREGDGRSPAGAFPLDTVFGFAATAAAVGARLPYLPLVEGHECVDDPASRHYGTIVDRARVPAVDWTSAERMRRIAVYRLGVVVGYDRPPRAGRGSCIFLHLWEGPESVTAGCTAMAAPALEGLVAWLDPSRAPAIVQLTEDAYRARRGSWRLP